MKVRIVWGDERTRYVVRVFLHHGIVHLVGDVICGGNNDAIPY
jgi:hypothetical protein